MKRPEPTLTKEMVQGVEDMVALVQAQNEEFYAEHPEETRQVDDTKLDGLRYKLMEHMLRMRKAMR